MRKFLIRIITVIALSAVILPEQLVCQPKSFDCYSVVVGKEASWDGSVLVAHNEDDTGNQILNFYRVPEIAHSQTDSVTFKNGAKIPQCPATLGFIWLQLPGMDVSDAYVNDKGVVVFSDGCPSREDNPELSGGGIVYWVRRLIAERAQTARQGVHLAGQLIEEFGYASTGRTYIIADKDEAWLLAAVHGKHWIARRVPDDQVAVIPNYYTIGEIDLSDSTQFLGSGDLIDYAVRRGWYHPGKDGTFHFANVYSSRTSLKHPGNTHRMMRGLNLLSDKEYGADDAFPFSFHPGKKVTINDLRRILRDHYEGCEFDKSDNYRLGNPHDLNEATICAGSTQFSLIAHLRGGMPADIGTVLWIAPYRPDVQVYVPWYLGTEKFPEGFAYADYNKAIDQQFNPPELIFKENDTHIYWKYVRRVKKVDENFKQNYEKIRDQIEVLEQKIAEEQTSFGKKIIGLYPDAPSKARKMMAEYSAHWAEEALK